MRILAALSVFVGATMFAAPNTTSDMAAGALIALVGLVGLFAPMRSRT